MQYLLKHLCIGGISQCGVHIREQVGLGASQGRVERLHELQRMSEPDDVVQPLLLDESVLLARDHHAQGQELVNVAVTTHLIKKEDNMTA